MTDKNHLFQPTVVRRSEREEEEVLVAASQQLIFACEEDSPDAARGKVAQVEHGTGASESHFSAPVSTGTIQKVGKLDWLKVPYVSTSCSESFVNFQKRFSYCMSLTTSKQLVEPL